MTAIAEVGTGGEVLERAVGPSFVIRSHSNVKKQENTGGAP